MDPKKDILNSLIEALGQFITSPYPYFGLIAVLELLGLQRVLLLDITNNNILYYFIIFSALLFFISYLVYRLIIKVGHCKMLPGPELIELEKLRKSSERYKSNRFEEGEDTND